MSSLSGYIHGTFILAAVGGCGLGGVVKRVKCVVSALASCDFMCAADSAKLAFFFW